MTILTLASSSSIRAHLLRNAGLEIRIAPARIDEESLTAALLADGAHARDVADALAEHKALKIANRNPQDLVLGCDQVLELDGALLTKPATPEDARAQLQRLRAKTHRLFTAAVLYKDGEPIWRHVDRAELTMRAFSDAFLDDYVTRHWEEIRHCVGCYQIEGFGIRLFEQVRGDLFSVQGLPLLPLLTTLSRRGDIPA